jgi:hypothetical protein
MTGDQSDMLSRIKAVLPTGWFPSSTPVLDGVLSGPAYMMAWLYSMLQFVILQSRRLTATGVYLDMIAVDFFGTFIKRRVNETDANFNIRIGKELFREKVTRNGMIQALTDLTGRAPAIFEPQRPADTGCWDGPTLAYNTAGGYGSLLLPFQYFITAYRPTGVGVASVAGYTTTSPLVTPTNGASITDGSGNVYTMSTSGSGEIFKNGSLIAGSNGTAQITSLAGVIWALSAPSGPWYTFVGGTFVAQTGSPFVGMPGAYGVGAIEYANPSMFVPPVADTDIQNVVNDVRPSATIAWMRISN